jgi:glucans biosynthesis protein C
MRETHLALRNLRGVLILLIVAFHCFSAYIVTQPAHPLPFDQPPYDWRAFPMIDNERWLGFDLFCAFQFFYLMQLMFFLSGLFVWPSISHRRWRRFVGHRTIRLGMPFVLGVYLLMPLVFFPVYRVTAVDPGWSAFWSHWTALPITPTGPMWFLWFLLALNIGAALIFRLAPGTCALLAPHLAKAATRPSILFVFLVAICAITYLPLSAIYSPWQWVGIGPFEVQASLGPQYAIFFLFGLAVGAYGHDRGLLDAHGALVHHWRRWLIGSFAAFFLWIISTALIAKVPGAPVAALQIVGDLGLVIFAASACFGLAGLFLRFANVSWPPLIDSVSEHAYGIYFFHYLFAIWLQFALLDLPFGAVAKGLIVLAGTVILSCTASIGTDRLVDGGRALLALGVTWFGALSPAGGRLSRTNLSD